MVWGSFGALVFDTIALNRKLVVDTTNCVAFAPFRGTPLHKTCVEKGYIKEALILTDKCLTLRQVPEEDITKKDVQNYMECSGKAIKLLESVGKRTGIPFNYSFLNDLQVSVVKNVQPKKTFTKFSGEVYRIR